MSVYKVHYCRCIAQDMFLQYGQNYQCCGVGLVGILSSMSLDHRQRRLDNCRYRAGIVVLSADNAVQWRSCLDSFTKAAIYWAVRYWGTEAF